MYQNWLSDNYKFISKWARIWCKTNEDADELISLFTIYLNENWTKFSLIDEVGRIKFTQSWLKNNVRWNNSEFNKVRRLNSVDDSLVKDQDYDDLLEIRCETDREDIKEWLVDLSQNFSESEVERLVKLREIYLLLQTHEKVIWDLYFTNMMSLRDISKKIKLPLSSVHNMVIELKQKIKENYGMDN